MGRSILEIYAALVCFVAVVCLAIAIGTVLYGLVSVISPSVTLANVKFEGLENNDVFWKRTLEPRRTTYTTDAKPIYPPRPSEAELTDLRRSEFDVQLMHERREGVQTVVKWGIVCIVDLLLFFFHWRILRPKGSPAAL